MYNKRRAECETVVTYFQTAKRADSVSSLRDVTLPEIEAHWSKLDPIGRKRARHVLTENDRVQRGSDALRKGDLVEFGRLVSASHASSRDDFENSSPSPTRWSRRPNLLPVFSAVSCPEQAGPAAP